MSAKTAPEELIDLVADMMREHGPDGHIDGHEIIAQKAYEWVLENMSQEADPAPTHLAQLQAIERAARESVMPADDEAREAIYTLLDVSEKLEEIQKRIGWVTEFITEQGKAGRFIDQIPGKPAPADPLPDAGKLLRENPNSIQSEVRERRIKNLTAEVVRDSLVFRYGEAGIDEFAIFNDFLADEIAYRINAFESNHIPDTSKMVPADPLPDAGKLIQPDHPIDSSKMIWTKDYPTVGGIYFYRKAGDAKRKSVDVIEMRDGVPYWFSSSAWEWRSVPDGFEWAGPIPEPAEPTPERGEDGKE